jgi:hypothetical protein
MVNEASKLNYYEVMELSPDSAHPDVIKSRYLELKAFYSSDELKAQGIFSPDELRGLQEILEEAYAVLGNQTLKAIYDEKLNLNNKATVISHRCENENSQRMKVETGAIENPTTEMAARLEPSAKVSGKIIWKLEYDRDQEMESWIANLTEWDGAALKKVREYKRVDINQLSHLTKINPFYISAVETMEPLHLPAPVFVRGYIIQICRALGLNEQKVAVSYMKAYQKVCDNQKSTRVSS